MRVASRVFGEADIVWAIQQRLNHSQTWAGIASILKTDVQTIQNLIWIHLTETGRLTKDVVGMIWANPTGRRGRPGDWNWLINRNGNLPT